MMRTGKLMKKVALNIKVPRVFVAASAMLGLLVSVPPAAANTAAKNGEPILMSQWRDARLSDGEPGVPAQGTKQGIKDKPVASSKRPARVDWNKILPQINGWIHAEPAEDGNRYLSRVAEEAKFFLGEFEHTYDVHVVWEDRQNSFPDMTDEFLSWVRQVQVMRHMAGTNAEAFQNAMQQFKQKISGEF